MKVEYCSKNNQQNLLANSPISEDKDGGVIRENVRVKSRRYLYMRKYSINSRRTRDKYYRE